MDSSSRQFVFCGFRWNYCMEFCEEETNPIEWDNPDDFILHSSIFDGNLSLLYDHMRWQFGYDVKKHQENPVDKAKITQYNEFNFFKLHFIKMQ